MELNKDPSKDRDEFISRIDALFCPMNGFNQQDTLKALVFDDTAYLDAVRAKKTACDTERQKYIDQYDAAVTEQEKAAVVGSVTLKNVV